MAKKLVTLLVVALSMVSALVPSTRSLNTVAFRTRNSQLFDKPKEDIAAEKLIFDKKTGRFFERNIDDATSEEFCLVDKETGKPILLTKEEKERIFLDAIQSFYFSGKANLSDEEFDKLKEDLSWEGSVYVSLNRDENLFLNAVQAYNKGKPIISDQQWDELKTKLKESGSKIAVQAEPKCYVDTGVCKVTWSPDTIRTNSLYAPAALISTTVYIGVLYELLHAVGINLNPLLALIVGAFPIRTVTKTITEDIFFKEPEVLYGPCPKCGAENRIFFGDVFGVQGDREEAAVKCTNCKSGMTIKRSTRRVSTLMSPKGAPAKAAAAGGDDDE